MSLYLTSRRVAEDTLRSDEPTKSDEDWAGLLRDDAMRKEAGREVGVYTRNLGAENDAKLADVMQEAGVEVNQADVKAFVEKAKPVWKMITDENKYADAAEVIEQMRPLSSGKK